MYSSIHLFMNKYICECLQSSPKDSQRSSDPKEDCRKFISIISTHGTHTFSPQDNITAQVQLRQGKTTTQQEDQMCGIG